MYALKLWTTVVLIWFKFRVVTGIRWQVLNEMFVLWSFEGVERVTMCRVGQRFDCQSESFKNWREDWLARTWSKGGEVSTQDRRIVWINECLTLLRSLACFWLIDDMILVWFRLLFSCYLMVVICDWSLMSYVVYNWWCCWYMILMKHEINDMSLDVMMLLYHDLWCMLGKRSQVSSLESSPQKSNEGMMHFVLWSCIICSVPW